MSEESLTHKLTEGQGCFNYSSLYKGRNQSLVHFLKYRCNFFNKLMISYTN